MKINISKTIDYVVHLFKERSPEGTSFLQEKKLSQGHGILRVYVVGKKRGQFKFVHINKDVYRVKYVRRLLTDRMPCDELKTGIHDSVVTSFAKTYVKFYRP